MRYSMAVVLRACLIVSQCVCVCAVLWGARSIKFDLLKIAPRQHRPKIKIQVRSGPVADLQFYLSVSQVHPRMNAEMRCYVTIIHTCDELT